MTKGCDTKSKLLECSNDRDVELQLQDMSGKDLYRAIVCKMLKNAHFICLTYDSTDPDSFRAVDTWHDIVKKANGNKDLEGILVSTKNDLGSLRAIDSQ